MAETYCGKSCADCTQKETLNCPGCRLGPGQQISGDCELARCVREKGHETCYTCVNSMNCGTFQSRGRIPGYRIQRLEAAEEAKRLTAARAPVLGKWLWLLFWLVVPSLIGSLLTQNFVKEALPTLSRVGNLLELVCCLAYGGILLKLAEQEEGYRPAAICSLVAGAANALTILVSGSGDTPGWTLIFTLPAAVVALYGEYREFLAHSAVLSGVDNDLSAKWESLWKWYIGTYIALFGSLILLLLVPILGLLVILAAVIALLVVGILKLVYLYRTAKLFREYPQ